jgi:hypothetical protein
LAIKQAGFNAIRTDVVEHDLDLARDKGRIDADNAINAYGVCTVSAVIAVAA